MIQPPPSFGPNALTAAFVSSSAQSPAFRVSGSMVSSMAFAAAFFSAGDEARSC